ncbi:uncharacterized protein N7518_010111 [Penicillium psychrosexuale]|uniref:uncharacterized protein n=1 Tax=Penicillium psychrosexuale TaxID=1002107 RepID=UPI002544EA5F|nr:uncharacterized protein N7518_010111 [Penicillium psychrosexuale]KAJ5781628.1 hypothetical protein N7518_010111 [Penicillium psychrosexuale]
MPAKQARVREVASQALPPLPLGPNHTESNALHTIEFVGELHRWSNFLRFVETHVQGQRWSTKFLKYTHGLGDPEAESQLIGDETGLQGVFNHSVGFMVGKILKAQSIDLEFADFKCLGSHYANTPDSILMTKNAQLKVVGELKVPWVNEHKMSQAYEEESMLCHLLAQPIKYMKDMNCMYGFMSNYRETIFLRQVLIAGKWVVDYSPVILASTSYAKTDLGNLQAVPVVSMRQCFLAVAALAEAQGPVYNTTPKSQWVVRM